MALHYFHEPFCSPHALLDLLQSFFTMRGPQRLCELLHLGLDSWTHLNQLDSLDSRIQNMYAVY